ncbi:MAG: SGNH/GDSL hydrolase family protein, partial [Bacteroidetes bacterium]|nr:SGNH/GDSL hydrolase family protein [Fibrella sp.]
MNLLVIGGCHTYGYGLSDNQCFVDQFTKQLEQWGCPVSVATYPLIELHQAMVLLSELPLNQYDLIILQLGHYWLQHPAGFQSLLIPLKKPSARLTRPGTPMMADELVRLRQAPVVLSGNEQPSVGKCLKTTLKLGLLYGLSATRKLT